MSYRLLVRRLAKADVHAATRWHELQRPGLGKAFVEAVDAALSQVAGNSLRYQIVHRDVRRVVLRRFPYGVFYRVAGDRIVVICVLHLHRDPSSWKSRLGRAFFGG